MKSHSVPAGKAPGKSFPSDAVVVVAGMCVGETTSSCAKKDEELSFSEVDDEKKEFPDLENDGSWNFFKSTSSAATA